MKKRIVHIVLLLTLPTFFLAFAIKGRNYNDDPKLRYEKILRKVGLMLEQWHYSPKKIDDAFSKLVLKKFIENLDPQGNIFIQSDIEGLRKYENSIDDEIHGADLESFFAINDLFQLRQHETSVICNDILARPFDYTKEETEELNDQNTNFTRSIEERKEVWRKQLKLATLAKYVDLLSERENSKDQKGAISRPDSTLEREARLAVKNRWDRFYAKYDKTDVISTDARFSIFVNQITESMDPHSQYLPPVESRSWNEDFSGVYYGIGASLKDDNGRIIIDRLTTGGPAWKSGEIKVGDEIIKVGQGNATPADVTGFYIDDVINLLRGAVKGSEVRIMLRRADGSEKVVSLLRDELKLEDKFARSAIISGDHKIGYIYLPEFYFDFSNIGGPTCSRDVAKEIRKLKDEKVEGIILDLRWNGGGGVDEASKMVGLFIKDGPVCIQKERVGKPYQLKDMDPGIAYSGPLTIIVNGHSASACEIFTSAMQDYKRAIIIGSSSTYGKGTELKTYPLNSITVSTDTTHQEKEDQGALNLTTTKYYRITGGSTQLRGVTPDIILPDIFEFDKDRERNSPTALPWDEIAKVSYKPWTSPISNTVVVNSINEGLKNNTTFNNIKADVEWLHNESHTISLNIDAYREKLKQLEAKSNELDRLTTLNQVMKVNNPAVDTSVINASMEKEEKNKQWLNLISSDIYIDESVKVINLMIPQKSAGKTN